MNYALTSKGAYQLRKTLANEGWTICNGGGRGGWKMVDGIVIVRSYNTIVFTYNAKTRWYHRHWNGWSSTTSRHINDTLKHFGLPAISKKEWEEMEVEPFRMHDLV